MPGVALPSSDTTKVSTQSCRTAREEGTSSRSSNAVPLPTLARKLNILFNKRKPFLRICTKRLRLQIEFIYFSIFLLLHPSSPALLMEKQKDECFYIPASWCFLLSLLLLAAWDRFPLRFRMVYVSTRPAQCCCSGKQKKCGIHLPWPIKGITITEQQNNNKGSISRAIGWIKWKESNK